MSNAACLNLDVHTYACYEREEAPEKAKSKNTNQSKETKDDASNKSKVLWLQEETTIEHEILTQNESCKNTAPLKCSTQDKFED